MSDNIQYYKKYYFLPSIKAEEILNHVAETTYLSLNELQIMSKLLTTQSVRSYAEYMRADGISCEPYVELINRKINEYICLKFFKNVYKNKDIRVENEDLCETFTYEGNYFFHPVTMTLSSRNIKVDITFYNKKVHDIFKLKSGKVYSQLIEFSKEATL